MLKQALMIYLLKIFFFILELRISVDYKYKVCILENQSDLIMFTIIIKI